MISYIHASLEHDDDLGESVSLLMAISTLQPPCHKLVGCSSNETPAAYQRRMYELVRRCPKKIEALPRPMLVAPFLGMLCWDVGISTVSFPKWSE